MVELNAAYETIRASNPKAEKVAKATKEPAKAKAAKKGNAKSAKKPRAAAKGDSYGCGACGESFPTMKAATAHALTHTS